MQNRESKCDSWWHDHVPAMERERERSISLFDKMERWEGFSISYLIMSIEGHKSGDQQFLRWLDCLSIWYKVAFDDHVKSLLKLVMVTEKIKCVETYLQCPTTFYILLCVFELCIEQLRYECWQTKVCGQKGLKVWGEGWLWIF